MEELWLLLLLLLLWTPPSTVGSTTKEAYLALPADTRHTMARAGSAVRPIMTRPLYGLYSRYLVMDLRIPLV